MASLSANAQQENMRFAALGLIAKRSEGIHGYRLKDEFEALCEDFWEINYGRLYRVLGILEETGHLEAASEVQTKRPNRKVYRITEKGSQSLDDWLLAPISDAPRPMRDELSLKLLFLGPSRIGEIADLIRQQRSLYLRNSARIEKRRRKLERAGIEMPVIALVMDGALMRVRADLAWLEHIERKIIREF